MPRLPSFADLVSDPEPTTDVLALAIAAEFGPVDVRAAFTTLDALGADLANTAGTTDGTPPQLALACGRLLATGHGYEGDRRRYDDPRNSMLDLVLARRRGLPILLSIVYVEVARRAGIPLAAVGLPGHFVAGHFGSDPPILIDPFNGGVRVDAPDAQTPVRPWRPHEIAWRMLNNLLASYQRRGNLSPAIRAAEMRLMLPAEDSYRETMTAELRSLQARLN